MEEEKKKKLKPVVFTFPRLPGGTKHLQNTTQQMLLLKALTVTQNPEKLKQMIGVRTVAEVYRTLDKLALRKEYHKALDKAGISFDYIVQGVKGIADTAYKDADKLNAYKTLLKSLGMDNYQDAETSTAGWEEALLKAADKKELPGADHLLEAEYDVKPPKVPDSVRKQQEEEADLSDSLYG